MKCFLHPEQCLLFGVFFVFLEDAVRGTSLKEGLSYDPSGNLKI